MTTSTKFTAAKWLGILILSAATIGVLYLSVQLAGILSTLVYAGLFSVGLFGVPMFILFKFTDMAGGGLLGKLHFLLGQFAFWTGVLVQRGDQHEMCPGRKTAEGYEAYIDGEWQQVADDHNVSILGMRPFIYGTDKDSRSFSEKRVDPKAEVAAKSDGGTTVTRAGIDEVPPDASVSGDDGEYLVDLKRLFDGGLKRVGDIALIEKAEEIEQRNQSKQSLSDKYSTVIGSIVGLVLGIVTGYAMLVGF